MDRFTYTVSDGQGGTDSATVTVAVAAVNDPPVAIDDAATTDEDTSIIIDVLPNDRDPDGDPLRIESVSLASNGTVENQGTSLVYTPDHGFHGQDVFDYTIGDGQGATATATVVVSIAPVNDPPVAQDDSAATPESTPVSIPVTLNDSDDDKDPLQVQRVATPDHGTASI